MCSCEEYNPDYDITLYSTSELSAMLRRYQALVLLVYPPFSMDELEQELNKRSI